MLKSITDFFERKLAPAQATGGGARHSIDLAAAALIVEVMRMDGETTDAERATALASLSAKLGLDDAEARALVALAEEEARNATDYFQFTSLVNRHYTQPQKLRIVEIMWDVAYADARATPYEEHLIRKVADLLYVDHASYIRAKLAARDAPR